MQTQHVLSRGCDLPKEYNIYIMASFEDQVQKMNWPNIYYV